MRTEVFDVGVWDEGARERVRYAAGVLRNGGIVAFPTETVYGIGACCFDEGAVRRVYAAKGRPSDNPMIVHIARASDIGLLAGGLSPGIVKLADAFWPGPLTMVVEKRDEVPGCVTGGLPTVGVRLPDSAVALELIRLAGAPVAAPSANLSGRPSPTRAEHVIEDLEGKVDVILAGVDCRVGIESTVVDMTASPPVVLRPGVVTRDDIEAVLDVPVEVDAETTLPHQNGQAPKSPGMKYRHYAPRARMVVVEGARERVRAEVARLRALNEGLGLRVGTLLFEERDFLAAAHDFYAALRALDAEGVDLILAGALAADSSVRCSHALSMMVCRAWVMVFS